MSDNQFPADEAQAFFANRRKGTLKAGSQSPYFAGWEPNVASPHGPLRYLTYAFQAPKGSPTYQMFGLVERRLAEHGIAAQPAALTHLSMFTIGRWSPLGPVSQPDPRDISPEQAFVIREKIRNYTRSAKVPVLRMTGELTLMPNTVSYELADFDLREFVQGLWRAVPEIKDLNVHPRNPFLSPLTEREGFAGLVQAAYGTAAYDLALVNSALNAINAELKTTFPNGVQMPCKTLGAMLHSIAYETELGVRQHPANFSTTGDDRATQWSAIPLEYIEVGSTLQHGL